MNVRITITGLAILLLSGCASTSGYVAADNPGDHGYSSRKIAGDRYLVNYNGNRRTNIQDTRDYALLRAAELTVEQGFDWFEVVDRETATTGAREPQVAFGYEQTMYVQKNCGLLGCSYTSYPASFSHVHVDSTRDDTRHSHTIEIVMGHESGAMLPATHRIAKPVPAPAQPPWIARIARIMG